MPCQCNASQYTDTTTSHDLVLFAANAERIPAQRAPGADVLMGSDDDWCQEAADRRSTSRGGQPAARGTRRNSSTALLGLSLVAYLQTNYPWQALSDADTENCHELTKKAANLK
jgi:hypothetical protein